MFAYVVFVNLLKFSIKIILCGLCTWKSMQIKEWNEIQCSLVPWTSCWFLGLWEFNNLKRSHILLQRAPASSNTTIENSLRQQSSLPASDTYMLARKQQTKFIPGIMTWYKCCFVRLNGYVFVSGNIHQDADRLALLRGEDRVLLWTAPSCFSEHGNRNIYFYGTGDNVKFKYFQQRKRFWDRGNRWFC